MAEKQIEPFVGRFQALGCPCEVQLDTNEVATGALQLDIAFYEAERIETKYSRYRAGTLVEQINLSNGKPVQVDDETAALLDFATRCFEMSNGLFDITTGVLSKGGNISLVGWNKVEWKRPFIRLPKGFQIDLGGICKEYAADRILSLLISRNPMSTLVNLGGDIAVSGDRVWSVGIEDIDRPGQIVHTVHIQKGGIATSGTTKREGHILNPKTGLPIQDAPQSVTVAARSCTEAGFWSTVAILQGANAETFLKENNLESWCYRHAA